MNAAIATLSTRMPAKTIAPVSGSRPVSGTGQRLCAAAGSGRSGTATSSAPEGEPECDI
jgi:hypothetical protein